MLPETEAAASTDAQQQPMKEDPKSPSKLEETLKSTTADDKASATKEEKPPVEQTPRDNGSNEATCEGVPQSIEPTMDDKATLKSSNETLPLKKQSPSPAKKKPPPPPSTEKVTPLILPARLSMKKPPPPTHQNKKVTTKEISTTDPTKTKNSEDEWKKKSAQEQEDFDLATRLALLEGEPGGDGVIPFSERKDSAVQQVEDYQLATQLAKLQEEDDLPLLLSERKDSAVQQVEAFELAERLAAQDEPPPRTSSATLTISLPRIVLQPTPTPHVPADLAHARRTKGQCVTCGTVLVEPVKQGLLQKLLPTKPSQLKPRTVEGLVRNGKCLLCHPSSEKEELSTRGPVTIDKEEQPFYAGSVNESNTPQGKGEVVWRNGDRFEGIMVDGHYLEGTFSQANGGGNWYQGSFEDSQPHGSGVARYTNGTVYKGSWRNGLPHGTGECRFANGDVYDGGWKQGQLEGSGRYKYSHGTVRHFEGSFQRGQRLKGKSVHRDGSVEYFCYENDWPTGTGIRWHVSGTKAWKVEGTSSKPVPLDQAHALGKAILS